MIFGISVTSQLFGKKQDQIIINGADRFILDALSALIPDAGTIRNIPAPDIHPLGGAITAAHTDAEADCIRRTALTPNCDYSGYPKSRQFVIGLNLNF